MRAGVLILGSTFLFGQSAGSRLSFEVASVKPTPAERQNQLRTDFCRRGGSFSVGGTPVLWSLKYAYRLKD